ncbi:tRNA (guanine(37)-N1)-methyltransferase Trm5b [Candidatus Gugararchaeum adminiculabundum]|nr:tRNA (guanine(37)-N1)-methyltransferase Trm5b [Candidatus Gugararchaeum adminiculabundum]
MVKCIKVKKTECEPLRKKLISQGALDLNYSLKQDGDFILLPVVRAIPGQKLVEAKLEKRKLEPHSLSQALAGKLTEKELKQLVTSFDMIGSIAVVEIPVSLLKKEKMIADAIMKVNRRIKTVAKKTSPMQGKFRVRKMKVIGGKKSLETIYRESGCSFKLDVSKVYFSPRLATERERIANQVKKGERVLALFAGVAPFPIVIASKVPNCEIAAIELNPAATKYAKENVKLNKFEKQIQIFTGDVRKIVPQKFKGWADRVLMPLPKSAEQFLDIALMGAKKGATIHFYSFGNVESPFSNARDFISQAALSSGRSVRIVNEHIVRPYAPRVVQVTVDFITLN